MRVGDTGFEPVASAVSRQRSPTELIALEVETGFEPVYTALQAVASPLGHSTAVTGACRAPRVRADDGIRTRDPHLGKVMLYQLSHVRATAPHARPPRCCRFLTLADQFAERRTGPDRVCSPGCSENASIDEPLTSENSGHRADNKRCPRPQRSGASRRKGSGARVAPHQQRKLGVEVHEVALGTGRNGGVGAGQELDQPCQRHFEQRLAGRAGQRQADHL